MPAFLIYQLIPAMRSGPAVLGVWSRITTYPPGPDEEPVLAGRLTASCPKIKLSSQALLEGISKTPIHADMQAQPPNAYRTGFGEGPL